MNVGELKQTLEGLPDNTPVTFGLNNNGTALSGGVYLTYAAPAGDPKRATVLTIRDEVSDEDESRDFMSQARVGLPDEFVELCERDGVDPITVLHGFIADLCGIKNTTANPRADGLSSHGSDERRMAEEYYDRVGYSYFAPQE